MVNLLKSVIKMTEELACLICLTKKANFWLVIIGDCFAYFIPFWKRKMEKDRLNKRKNYEYMAAKIFCSKYHLALTSGC